LYGMWHDDEIACHLAHRKWKAGYRSQRSRTLVQRESRDFSGNNADVYEFIRRVHANRGWLGDVSQLDRRPRDRRQIACSTDREGGQAVPSGISDEHKLSAGINGDRGGLVTASERGSRHGSQCASGWI